MNVLKKRVLPVAVGLLAGWLTVFILEAASHLVYPPPTDLDYTDKEAVAAFMDTLPTTAFVLPLAAWMIASLIGGLAGTLINKDNWRNSVIIIGVILALGSIINMTMIPHPTWLMIAASIGYVPFAFMGGRMVLRNKV